MAHTHTITLSEERYIFSSKARNFTIGLMIAGLIMAVLGGFLAGNNDDHHSTTAPTENNEQVDPIEASGQQHTEHNAAASSHTADSDAEAGHGSPVVKRIWANLLLNAYYFMLFAIGATFFLAVNYLANAGWTTVFKRVMEAMGAYLPIALLTLAIVVFFGKNELYHWAHYESLNITDASDPNYDAILDGKKPFLNTGMLIGGLIVILGIWIFFERVFRKASVEEDEKGGITFFDKSFKYSAAFIFIFAFSFSILSWLLMMSLDAHWFSTIYSVYNFAIAFVTALTVITMFVLYLKSQGYMSYVTDEHIHDLGKFMFAFTIFWTYIWIAQYLLIWYANLPEEVVYYDARRIPPFRGHWMINLVLNFVLPFMILMTRGNKRNPKVLVLVGIIILVGRWNDLYLMVMPGTVGDAAGVGFLEIGTTTFFAGLFIFVVLNALSKVNLFPKNHPYLQESLVHEVTP